MTPRESSHWYDKDGNPCHEQPNKSKGGLRPTTLKDARRLNLLPSVTTILGCMAKPGLDLWKQRNAIHAALTTPRLQGEGEDAFCDRILSEDVHSISDAAKERGTAIHGAIEAVLSGVSRDKIDPELMPFVGPVLEACEPFGIAVNAEKSIVGKGYAGKLDALFSDGDNYTLVDFKTASTIPAKQYDEHLLQLSAYAATIGFPVRTANIYIDSNTPGVIKVVGNEDSEWRDAFENGFMPLFNFWQWKNNYKPL
jgi:hypothetical protein